MNTNPINTDALTLFDPLPADRHVIWVGYWDDKSKPQPGDEVIRDRLRVLGSTGQMTEVSVMLSVKTGPSFAAGTIEALTSGIPAGAIYNVLSDLGATRWMVLDSEEIPEWVANTWDETQQAKDTAGEGIKNVGKIGSFLAKYAPEIFVGVIASVLGFYVLRELKQ